MTKEFAQGRPATIEEAFAELSQEAFAVWIRLMVASDTELASGRMRVAGILGYSEGRSNSILRELKLMGYVDLTRASNCGVPTQISIKRSPIIPGRSRFVRLGHITEVHENVSPKRGRRNDIDAHKAEEVLKRICDAHENVTFLGNVINNSINAPSSAEGDLHQIGHSGTHVEAKNGFTAHVRETLPAHEIHSKMFPPKREKFVTIDGGLGCDLETDHDTAKRRLAYKKSLPNLILGAQEKLKEEERKHRQEKAEGKKAERLKEQRRSLAGAQQKAKPINWSKLDLRGDPTVTFTPTEDERKRLLDIFERDDRDGEKRRICNKLTIEMCRMYTRYRREVEEANGNRRQYAMLNREKRYARASAMLCIQRRVTPRQLLEYWHAHIRQFADGKMRVPPIAFLSSPANVDTVACALVKHAGARKWQPGDFSKQVIQHSFSDTSGLDKRLRAGLERAGFSMSQYSDRYLVTVQSVAKAMAKGTSMFVPQELRQMCDWAARNIFKNQN